MALKPRTDLTGVSQSELQQISLHAATVNAFYTKGAIKEGNDKPKLISIKNIAKQALEEVDTTERESISLWDRVNNLDEAKAEVDERSTDSGKKLYSEAWENIKEGAGDFADSLTEESTNAPPSFTQEEQDRSAKVLQNGLKLNDAQTKWLKTCLPCGLRAIGDAKLEVSFLFPQLDFLDALGLSAENLKDLMNGTDIKDDLCDMLNKLKEFCLPDLLSIISILLMMQAKLTMDLSLDLSSLVATLLGMLLSGILMNIKSTLDQYIKLVLDPIHCIINSLEKTISNLSVSGGIAQAERSKDRYNRSRRKLLERRDIEIQQEIYRLKTSDSKKQHLDKSQLKTLDRELKSNREKIKALGGDSTEAGWLRDQTKPYDKAIASGADAMKRASSSINSVKKGLTGGLEKIVESIYGAETLIKKTIKTYSDELSRTLMGRITSQNDIMILAAQISEYARLIGFIKVLIGLLKSDRKDFLGCSNKAIMSEYAKLDNVRIVQGLGPGGTDEDDRVETFVVFPKDTSLAVTTIQESTAGDLYETSEVYNSEGEVSEANKKGIIPDIGIIDAADFGLSYNNGIDVEIDGKYVKVLSSPGCACEKKFSGTDNIEGWARSL